MKICVIMLGLFGDVLARTPIIKALKEKYPHSQITAVVDDIGYEILQNNPFINELITMNRKRDNILKYIYSKISTQIKIIIRRFDLMIDLYNGTSSKNMAKLSFAAKIIKNQKNSNVYNFSNKFHMTSALFEMISEIKFETLSLAPQFFVNQNGGGYYDKNSYIISLGSGDLKKILDLKQTFRLIKYIYENHNLSPIIIQNPKQEFLQANLIQQFLIPNQIPFIKLDKKSINELACIIQNANFIIVPDTGILHLAFAMNTPAFCVFTHTNPVYVLPQDKNYIFGYSYKLKIPAHFDQHGNKNCTKDIEFNTIKRDFDLFYQALKANKFYF